MSKITLPSKRPYLDMMAFYGPNHVELVVPAQCLRQCSIAEQTVIDVLAEEVEQQPGGIFWFTYSRQSWMRLCDAVGELRAQNHCGAADCVPPDNTFCVWVDGCTVDWDNLPKPEGSK